MRFRNKAFTLIEMLVVISIIAMLLGIALTAPKRTRRPAEADESMPGTLHDVNYKGNFYNLNQSLAVNSIYKSWSVMDHASRDILYKMNP